ncbi:MAG: aldehyde ferredoxin oxidoreductase [Deltaproteobacteria bacterium]|nr:aldehyde ferredoxin oxidoreductase [Deltaproteobacteria bacterium]
MKDYRALHINAADGSSELRKVDDPRVMGPVDYAWRLGDQGRKHTTIGSGPIAGSFVPGSNRLVVCGWSPLVDSFFPSTMGGAGLPWDGIGANYVAISGKAAQPCVLEIYNVKGKLGVTVEPIDVETVWKGHGDQHGVYALMHRVYEEHGAQWNAARVLCVGPAAARTRAGAIASAPIKGGKISHVDTWAGRGGLGSRLLREHNIAAICFGGDYEDVDLTDRKLVDGMFAEKFGKPLKMVDLEKTTKYRFDPKFKTGGTFGSNYHNLRELVLLFNYKSVLLGDEERLALWKRLIEAHYVKQFDEEIVAEKKNFNCGEPCGAVCKKVHGEFKKDYEPYQTMGPLTGIFDQRAAEELNRYADACGFDGIQIGGELAWLMECMKEGWLGADVTGIADKPEWDTATLDPVTSSAHNASIGKRLIRWMLEDPRAAAAREGIRTAARTLGGAAAQAAVYNANGDEHGCMVPNQYWVPGVYAPMPIMGRYYIDYGYDWKPPRELGKKCADRMVQELMIDNYGMCRFHRGWAETLLPEIVNDFFGQKLDTTAHHLAIAREISADYRARPWETERVLDIIATYLIHARAAGCKDEGLSGWIDRFQKDKQAAGLAYWQEIHDGVSEKLKG